MGKNLSKQELEQFFNKTLNIYHYEFMPELKDDKKYSFSTINGQYMKKALPDYAIIIPSTHENGLKSMSIYQTHITIMKDVTPENSAYSMIKSIAEMVMNPENQKFFPNNHVDIYNHDPKFLKHMSEFKRYFKDVNEYLEVE